MKYTYNKDRHLELLQTLPNSEKNCPRQDIPILDSIDMINFDKPKGSEELEYFDFLFLNHLHWENRTQYYELIQEILDKQIDFKELNKKFDLIEEAGTYLLRNLILLEPDKKSEGFAVELTEILLLKDKYCPIAEFCDDDRFPEEEFKKIVKNIFTKLKEWYP